MQLFVGAIGPGEIGVANVEAFFVVVGVNEPGGNVIGRAATDLAGGGVVDVQTLERDGVLAIL